MRKKIIRRDHTPQHAWSTCAPLQALVATSMELEARAGTIFYNCEKSNDEKSTLGKGDKSAIQSKLLF